MTLKLLDQDFSICQVEDYSQVDWEQEFCFAGKTDEERSLVCPTSRVPPNILRRDDGWRALRVEGVLDFSLTGILAGISTPLAEGDVGIFAISTYNTDYILVKAARLDDARRALTSAGFTIG